MQQMINHKPHKKLYYTSGLISLLLLPILCVLYLQKTKVFEPEYVIGLNMWTPEQAKNWREQGRNFDIHPQRNYVNIDLTGNEKEDKTKLDFIQLQMRDLLKNKDTVSGIHIVFGNQSKYLTLVETLNICLKEKARTYVLVGNDFWFYNYFPKPVIVKKVDIGPILSCGTGDANYLINLKEAQKEKQILRQLKKTPQSLIIFYIVLSILFLFMCGIEIRKIIKII
jgi:hypothetical protein